MNKYLTGVFCALSISVASTASAQDTIRIVINEWTGQALSAHIAGSIFTEMGLKTEYITAGAVPQFVGLSAGGLDVNPEVWSNNVGDIFPKAIKSGDLINVGDLGLDAKEGWYYPPYMEKLCPGLPNYEALYDCAPAFAASDTFPNGRLITYPADWGTRSTDLVAAMALPFQPVAGGSEGAMLAELKAAIATKQPMLMMFWQPHWIHAEIDLGIVSWDSTLKDCDSGVQTRGDACGFSQPDVWKVSSKDFRANHPDAYAAYAKMSLTNEIQNALIAKVDNEGMSVEDAVAEWMAANKPIWSAWIK